MLRNGLDLKRDLNVSPVHIVPRNRGRSERIDNLRNSARYWSGTLATEESQRFRLIRIDNSPLFLAFEHHSSVPIAS